ncbi:hypothetical protein ACFVQB_19775 [Paenibacillus sp. NPDC057886]|uniref:hypothetical protein n=1 Tax=Paenibacillus sp. NPDC057886 TaxID=3346270 RepID=UPI00368D5D70
MKRINSSTSHKQWQISFHKSSSASPLVFISGQVASNEKGELVGKDGYLFQAK